MCTAPGRRRSSRARTPTWSPCSPTAARTAAVGPAPSPGPPRCANCPPTSCARRRSTWSSSSVRTNRSWPNAGSASRRPGRDVPAVYLEHNAPDGDVPDTRHPFADRDDLTLVHVTHFNRLFWDNGSTRTEVIEHGIVDPGHRYTGRLARAAVVVNEPVRRGRYTGTDLLPALAEAAPLDVFGMRTEGLAAHLGLPGERCRALDLPQNELHAAMAERRLYVHPVRWTSLGLSLLEAMHLGMPVVALATTEAVEAVPPGAGVLSTRPEMLAEAARRYLAEPEAAAEDGARARQAALGRYGLKRFLNDWERVMTEVRS
ncbi:hypothetical protein SGLAM104S_04275 [Streptomyces glaucescens]